MCGGGFAPPKGFVNLGTLPAVIRGRSPDTLNDERKVIEFRTSGGIAASAIEAKSSSRATASKHQNWHPDLRAWFQHGGVG
jgi:hypothetical protein